MIRSIEFQFCACILCVDNLRSRLHEQNNFDISHLVNFTLLSKCISLVSKAGIHNAYLGKLTAAIQCIVKHFLDENYQIGQG